ncbi:alpha/beta hydrolase [Psychrobium sp. 1_MG-2023]|uniref:alpha/beta hydrolase n=1 Tax=Psychrobium sp. 1_MG-2023 TaxID=3062624 RepID=UPI0026B44576|nr:alpha/beta hydrolase [Psychrobium sp. 1_MG-2023]MDP2562193.1 alpha/beta hydrolase [Psychrobium sp. 1_MG-2023]
MREVSFTLPHITLSGISQGDESKPTLLLLHGWLDNAASFIPLLPFIKDYHVVAIDWPGHGYSMHRPSGASYHLTDYVNDLYVLIAQQNWQSLHIIGHSLGAIVASLFASAFPEKLDKLVLIEALGPLTANENQTTSILRKSILSQHKAQTKRKPVHDSTESAVAARLAVSDFGLEQAKLLVERSITPVEGGVTWRGDRRLRNLSPWRMTESQAHDVLNSISSDTLLILAEQGYIHLRTGIKQRQLMVEKLSIKSVAGGHHVHMESPQCVWQYIEQHLMK